MENGDSDRCAIILAGGDGTRLRVLTDKMPGGPRPKQFCALLGPETMFTQTRRRVAQLIPDERTLTIVTRSHDRFYTPLLADSAPQSIVVQPANHGTAPAILYALMRATRQFHDGSVAVFPSDHYVGDDTRFMGHVKVALDAVDGERDTVVLVGAPATAAETGYGWIEPGGQIGRSRLYRVRRFWEKPSPASAQALWQRGCLWNTFVMVSRASTLVSLIASALPDLCKAFDAIEGSLGTGREDDAIERLYREIEPISFSDRVLALAGDRLAVLPLSGVEWSDIGELHRIRRILDGAKLISLSPNESVKIHQLRAGSISSLSQQHYWDPSGLCGEYRESASSSGNLREGVRGNDERQKATSGSGGSHRD